MERGINEEERKTRTAQREEINEGEEGKEK